MRPSDSDARRVSGAAAGDAGRDYGAAERTRPCVRNAGARAGAVVGFSGRAEAKIYRRRFAAEAAMTLKKVGAEGRALKEGSGDGSSILHREPPKSDG